MILKYFRIIYKFIGLIKSEFNNYHIENPCLQN